MVLFILITKEVEKESKITYITLNMDAVYNNSGCSHERFCQLSKQHNTHVICVPIETHAHDFLAKYKENFILIRGLNLSLRF